MRGAGSLGAGRRGADGRAASASRALFLWLFSCEVPAVTRCLLTRANHRQGKSA
jgi:hypothetical protein